MKCPNYIQALLLLSVVLLQGAEQNIDIIQVNKKDFLDAAARNYISSAESICCDIELKYGNFSYNNDNDKPLRPSQAQWIVELLAEADKDRGGAPIAECTFDTWQAALTKDTTPTARNREAARSVGNFYVKQCGKILITRVIPYTFAALLFSTMVRDKILLARAPMFGADEAIPVMDARILPAVPLAAYCWAGVFRHSYAALHAAATALWASKNYSTWAHAELHEKLLKNIQTSPLDTIYTRAGIVPKDIAAHICNTDAIPNVSPNEQNNWLRYVANNDAIPTYQIETIREVLENIAKSKAN